MTQENSPSEQSETSTEADVTLVPPVVDSAPQIPDAEPADSPASSDTELESLVVDSAAEVAPSDTPQPANPYTAPATESADADEDSEVPDPYTASLLAGTLHPAPTFAGSAVPTPVQKQSSTLQRVLSIVLVVAVAVTTAILFFKERGVSPITDDDFGRLASSLSGVQGFGDISVNAGKASDIDECEAYAAFDENSKDFAESRTGFDGDGVFVMLRFLKHQNAIDFALASNTCVSQNSYTNVQIKEETTGGLFSVVNVYEITTQDEANPLVLHIAVYRNVAAWNLDSNLDTPIAFEQWKEWAGGEFMDAVDDSRTK